MADWRSAGADMRFLGIDEYLAALNVLVDHVGGLVDLIGLCQGGWLSLVYAGRFPAKVRKLAMAGAPVDIAARRSRWSRSRPQCGEVLGQRHRCERHSRIFADGSADRLIRIHAARSRLQELEFL